MGKKEYSVKMIGTAIAELITLITIVKVISSGEWERILLAFGTLFLVLVPALMEKLFHCKVSLPLYIFGLFYAIGPMFGHCWKFYYTISWWDKMLHAFGGVAFALIGAFLFERMAQGKQKPYVVALFALIFSIAVAAVWENCRAFAYGAQCRQESPGAYPGSRLPPPALLPECDQYEAD